MTKNQQKYQEPKVWLLALKGTFSVIMTSPEPGTPGEDEPYNPGGDF